MTSVLESTRRRRGVATETLPRPAAVAVDRGALPSWAASLTWATTVVGVLAAWVVGYGLGLSALQEHHAQHSLYARFRQELATQTAPPRYLPSGQVAPLRAGEPVALITSPAAGLHDVVVVQGSRSGDLRAGPGHVPGTVLPGEQGTTWIVGRGATFGAPFAHITSLHAGARITLTSQLGRFSYVVNDVRGPGDAIPASTAPARLTLATATGSGWRTGWAPTHAVYVDATLSGAPRPATGAPQAVSRADGVMQSDPAALVPLFLWLLGLVGTVLVIVWARSRWGPWQSWVAGAPVVVAALWGAGDSLLQLLPNLI